MNRLVLGMLCFLLLFPTSFLYSARTLNDGEIVRLINGYRQREGLGPLIVNGKLSLSSRLKADEMGQQRYFAHTNPAGDPFSLNFQRVNYRYGRIGEILAKGCRNERCVLEVWVNSPQHRQEILNPAFQDIGCSNCPCDPEGYYVVCHFGRRMQGGGE